MRPIARLTGDATFSHVNESNEDNVFVLIFESSEEKHFVSRSTSSQEREREIELTDPSSLFARLLQFWFQAANANYALQAQHM